MGTEMTELTLTELGAEGQEYVRTTLRAGHALSRALSESAISRSERAFTLLPVGVRLPSPVEFEHSIGIGDGAMVSLGLSRKMEALCMSAEGATVIFEDLEFRRGDPGLAQAATRILYLGEDVYHLARSCAAGEIGRAIMWAESASWLMGVIAETQIEATNETITETELQLIAQTAIAVVVSAFDGEGYILLLKDGIG